MSDRDALLVLNRMEVEEVGYNSRKLAEEIHHQLGALNGPVPVKEIAMALDIVEIKEGPLTTFEGALLTTAQRTDGSILVNSSSSVRRRRFTIAHELLHFLNDKHVQTEEGFNCRRQDINQSNVAVKTAMPRHQRQEAEANRFAIELLAPRKKFRPHLNQNPDLCAVVELSQALNISKEAIARRFIELSQTQIALIFHRGLTVRYVLKQDDFPRLSIWNAAPMPPMNDACDNRGLTKTEWMEMGDWLNGSPNGELTAQTLFQQNGFGMTLLVFEGEEDHGSDGVEDAFDRYNRWNR